MRAIVTGTITFGLVSIPVKVYTAAASNAVSFNLMTPDGKRRVKQKLVDPESGDEVDRNTTQKGYEFAKDQFVIFTPDELKALESTDTSKTMDIKEFVDEVSVPALQVEKSYYLGPNKGGDKGYALLAQTLRKLGKVAIAQWTNRAKDHLVAIRAHEHGLVLQQLYYASEIRNFDEVEVAKLEISEAEESMAAMLVEKMASGTFDASKYQDRYAKRVAEAVEAKVQGSAATIVTPNAPQTTVMDLFSALKASIEGGKPSPEAPKAKKGRKPRSKKS